MPLASSVRPASGLVVTGASGASRRGVASGAKAAASSAAAVSATSAGRVGGLAAGWALGFVPFSSRFDFPVNMIVLPLSRTRNPCAAMSPEGPCPVTGSSPSARVGSDIDMGGVRDETRAVLVHQVDVTEQIQQLRLSLVHRRGGGHHDQGAVMHRHFRPRVFQRHQIVSVGRLPADRRSHDKGTVEAVDPGIAGIEHSQFVRFAQIDDRKPEPHAVQQRNEPRPNRRPAPTARLR